MSLPQKTIDLLALIDESRLLILKEVITCTDPLCGCDLVERLHMPKNLLSYHVKALREAGFLEETRCGQKKQYRIAESRKTKVHQLLSALELA